MRFSARTVFRMVSLLAVLMTFILVYPTASTALAKGLSNRQTVGADYSHSSASTPSCTNHPSGPGPYNSCININPNDKTNTQSETTIAVCDSTLIPNCPGITVMVGYNDDYNNEGTGYSYAFDGGTRWIDGGGLPKYVDSSGAGSNGGDPGLTVDKNGTFYFSQIVFTANNTQEFIGMSKCNYSSSTGKIGCGRPLKVSASIIVTNPLSYFMDKPAITYDPVNNRVYVTWTSFALNSSGLTTAAVPQMRYYNISTNSFSKIYSFGSFANGNGTDPVVTSSGLVYVFFLQQATQGQAQAIVYFTFNNGTITTNTLASIQPAASLVSACGPGQEAFTTQAFTNSTAARTNEFPAATIDSSGNIDVVWEAAPPFGGGSGHSVIWIATIPAGGGSPYIQVLPDKENSAGTLLIQWQPAIAFAGGTSTLAVTYFQIIQLSDGSYQIERDQVTAPASSSPTFSAAKMISTVSWKADKTNPYFDQIENPCYMGDYSASASTSIANVVWSYWGDNRDVTSGTGAQPDIYGLYLSVP